MRVACLFGAREWKKPEGRGVAPPTEEPLKRLLFIYILVSELRVLLNKSLKYVLTLKKLVS